MPAPPKATTITGNGTLTINYAATATGQSMIVLGSNNLTIDDGVTVILNMTSDINTPAATDGLHIISGTLNGGVNAVKNDENGVCVIDNGTFGNTVQAVLINWETMTVNGGTFNGQVMCIVNGTWADDGSEPIR